MRPHEIVAVILALCVFTAIIGSIYLDSFMSERTISDAQSDIMMVLIGGLITYIGTSEK